MKINQKIGLVILLSIVLLSATALAATNVHVHKPPAVILNETPEEFHIFTGLCKKI